MQGSLGFYQLYFISAVALLDATCDFEFLSAKRCCESLFLNANMSDNIIDNISHSNYNIHMPVVVSSRALRAFQTLTIIYPLYIVVYNKDSVYALFDLSTSH